MKKLNFIRGTGNGHLLGQVRARVLGRISRFADHWQQAIANLEFLGLVAGTVASVTLLLPLLHHQTVINAHKGVI